MRNLRWPRQILGRVFPGSLIDDPYAFVYGWSPMRPVAKIKPLARGRAEVVMPAVRVAAADTGNPLPVIAASGKVIAGCLDPL